MMTMHHLRNTTMVGGTNMEDDMQDGMAIDGLGVRSCRCQVNLRQNVHNSIRFLACCKILDADFILDLACSFEL